jgi:hypothetical protein
MENPHSTFDPASKRGMGRQKGGGLSIATPRSLPHPVTGQLFFSPVPPGTGWPEDVAAATTPIARTAAEVNTLAAPNLSLDELGARISLCRACPRLVTWREDVAREKRRSFADQPYWGRPIPGWGDRYPLCSSSDWRRQPTGQTVPAGCSPETDRGTGCSAPCTASAWPRNLRASTQATVSSLPASE